MHRMLASDFFHLPRRICSLPMMNHPLPQWRTARAGEPLVTGCPAVGAGVGLAKEVAGSWQG